MYINLPDYYRHDRYDGDGIPGEIQIQLSADRGPPLAIKHFKFHELQIIEDIPHSLPFLESCGHHLRVLDLRAFDLCEVELYLLWVGKPTGR